MIWPGLHGISLSSIFRDHETAASVQIPSHQRMHSHFHIWPLPSCPAMGTTHCSTCYLSRVVIVVVIKRTASTASETLFLKPLFSESWQSYYRPKRYWKWNSPWLQSLRKHAKQIHAISSMVIIAIEAQGRKFGALKEESQNSEVVTAKEAQGPDFTSQAFIDWWCSCSNWR